MHTYSFQSPQRVLSGRGSLQTLGTELESLGKTRALVLTGNTLATKTALVEQLEALLGNRHAGTFSGCKQHVPASTVDTAVEHARETGADVLIAFGGGSPIDTTKIVAHRMLGDRPREDMPQIAIPTTLSAGEFTAIGGITDEAKRIKRGVRDQRILPTLVIHDPEVTVDTPPELWASTGIKALDHAIEALWSPRAHPVTDTLALEAIRKLSTHLRASIDPGNLKAREECQLAAWMSIFGVSNVGMRLSHPLGHQIGARWNVPHGITSCIVLPEVMRYLAYSTADAQDRIADAMTIESAAGSAPDKVRALIDSLHVPTRLSQVGAYRDELPLVAQAVEHELTASKSPDADTVTQKVILDILEKVW